MKTVLNFDTKCWALNCIRDSKTFQKKYLLEENQQIIINIILNVKSTFGVFFWNDFVVYNCIRSAASTVTENHYWSFKKPIRRSWFDEIKFYITSHLCQLIANISIISLNKRFWGGQFKTPPMNNLGHFDKKWPT